MRAAQVADTVIHMDAYVPVDVTARAKAIASASGAGPSACVPPAGVRLPAPGSLQRHLFPSSFAVQAKCTARSVVRSRNPAFVLCVWT